MPALNYDDFIFFYVGGTCGNFVKSIFVHYADIVNNRPPEKFFPNPITGDCHMDLPIVHTHSIDNIDHSKRLVVIDFDDDDKTTIVRMAFHKYVKVCQLANNLNFLTQRWGVAFSGVSELDEIEKIFIHNPDFLIFEDWKQQLQGLTPAISFQFKEILFGDINGKIASFFHTDPRAEIDEYIYHYRNINKKYILYT